MPWIGTADDVAQALVRILLRETQCVTTASERWGVAVTQPAVDTKIQTSDKIRWPHSSALAHDIPTGAVPPKMRSPNDVRLREIPPEADTRERQKASHQLHHD